MFSTLALRQSSCTWLMPDLGWPFDGPAGNAPSPRRSGIEKLIEEALPDLVDDDHVLERFRLKLEARRSAQRERRVTRKHGGVGIARRKDAGDVERGGVGEVLLHPREVRAYSHAGDDAARILTARAQQRPAARHESGLSESGIEHAAELRIGAVPARADDDGFAGPDENRLLAARRCFRSARGSPDACPTRDPFSANSSP